MSRTVTASRDERPGGRPGQGLRRRIALGLALAAGVPLALLAWVLVGGLLPRLDPIGDRSLALLLVGSLALAVLLAAAGAWTVWGVGAAVARAARAVGALARVDPSWAARDDEVGALMAAYGRMRAALEQQAAEINQFADRLDGAYKELEAAQARLKEFSFRDDVTRLYNRRFFMVRLEEEVARHRRFNHPVALVLIDLDGFKAINDDLGHAAGDETLQGVAEVLLRHSRGINVMARYGGDEFAVLLVETPRSGAEVYAERMRGLLARHPFSHGRPVTASFGVAALPEDVPAAGDALVRAADEALYAAKRAGKNQVSLAPPSPPASS